MNNVGPVGAWTPNLVPNRVSYPGTLRLEMIVIGAILLFTNLGLLHGALNTSLLFVPGAVAAGEWWRLLTHPFVHVTWYHLLLDGSAFFLLYHDLGKLSAWRRIGFVFASAGGGLLVPLLTDPMLSIKGLCGLSGIGHGLMVISALESMRSGDDSLVRRIGLISLLLVIGKSLFEALSGKILFAFLYFGMVGDPIAATHAGGALGALIAWGFLNVAALRQAICWPGTCLIRRNEANKVQLAQ